MRTVGGGAASVAAVLVPIPTHMWTYVLRHRLLLRAIYARSTPVEAA